MGIASEYFFLCSRNVDPSFANVDSYLWWIIFLLTHGSFCWNSDVHLQNHLKILTVDHLNRIYIDWNYK
jgi:hypothetical protein